MTKQKTNSSENSSFREKVRDIWFSFYIARRYLFSKKSHNVVNIITAVSATGICVGTIAMVCILSVFNGMDAMITGMFSTFDPDIRITASKGKTFQVDADVWDEVWNLASVEIFTEVLEENALLSYRDKQMPVTIKGVDEQEFREMTQIDSIMVDGDFILYDGGFERIVTGFGVAKTLGLGAYFIDPVHIYAPKRTEKVNLLRPERSITQVGTFISGIFLVQQAQYDENYALISIDYARKLFEYDENTVSAVELKLKDDANKEQAKKQIQKLLGNDFQVKNRYEQQEAFYKIMKMERWITYLILCLILLIASFNIIGSLSMLIMDKSEDISTLRSMGADNRLIKRIFLFEGWMISITGALAGIVLGTIICFSQQYFGWLSLINTYEAYPVVVKISDILVSFVTVLVIGFLAAYYPVRYIRRKMEI